MATNYSIQLPDIAPPVESKAGALVQAAGEAEAQAVETEGKADVGLLTFLGTTGIAAGRGRMEAAEESEIGAEIERIKEASRQGTLDRAAATARMGAIVKRYSAEMPGRASEFRRIAAEATGIANIDSSEVHALLTKEGAGEKQREREAAARMQAIAEIARKAGKLPEDIREQDLTTHYQRTQAILADEDLKRNIERSKLGQEETDKAYGQRSQLQLGVAIADILPALDKLVDLNKDPAKAEEANSYGLQLSNLLSKTLGTLSAQVREMASPAPGKVALSAAEADRIVEGYRKEFAVYQEAVKNADGRNMLGNMVKNAKGRVDLLSANLTLANPMIAVWNVLRAGPELFRAWTILRGGPEFEKIFGKDTTDAMRNVLKNPEQYANIFGRVIEGKPVDIGPTSGVPDDVKKVIATDMFESLRKWSEETQPTEEKKTAYVNVLKAAGEKLNPVHKKETDKFYSFLTNVNTERFINGLTKQQRVGAFVPLVANTERAISNVVSQIKTEVQKYNEEAPQGREQTRIDFVFDNLSQQFVVRETVKPTGVGSTLRTTPEGGVTGLAVPPATRPGMDVVAMRRRAEGLSLQLNKMVEVYTFGVRFLNPDLSTKVRDVAFKVLDGYEKGRWQPLEPAVLKELGVPKNTEEVGAAVGDRELDALIFAESGNNPAAVGDSGKAVGLAQMHPDAAREAGLKVGDGVDERKDPVKAKEAARVYFGQQVQAYGGDLLKAVASWNMGPTRFKQHLEKTGDLWMLDLPDATKGLIKRFRSRLQ